MVGERIRELLEIKGISQSELGRIIGKERGNINKLLKSDNMGIQTVIQIAEALNVPVNTLIEDEGSLTKIKEEAPENKKYLEQRIEDLEFQIQTLIQLNTDEAKKHNYYEELVKELLLEVKTIKKGSIRQV